MEADNGAMLRKSSRLYKLSVSFCFPNLLALSVLFFLFGLVAVVARVTPVPGEEYNCIGTSYFAHIHISLRPEW